MRCERCDRVPGLPVLCATCQRELLERERATPVVVGPPVTPESIMVGPSIRTIPIANPLANPLWTPRQPRPMC